MPFDAPVTTAVLPVSLLMMTLEFWLCTLRCLDNHRSVTRAKKRSRPPRSLDFRESFQIRVEHVALQDEPRELAFADNLDEPRRRQLFQMMRDGGRAHAMGLVQHAAGQRLRLRADLREH